MASSMIKPVMAVNIAMGTRAMVRVLAVLSLGFMALPHFVQFFRKNIIFLPVTDLLCTSWV
jgi:hypothetical protein